jgi:hypothetical protein
MLQYIPRLKCIAEITLSCSCTCTLQSRKEHLVFSKLKAYRGLSRASLALLAAAHNRDRAPLTGVTHTVLVKVLSKAL